MPTDAPPDAAYAATVPYRGGTIVIRPVSYKQAKAMYAELAKLAEAASLDRVACLFVAGLKDTMLDLFEPCCTPRLDDVPEDQMPITLAGQCFAAWVVLHTGGAWNPTVGLLDKALTALAGQPVSLRSIALRLSSLPASPGPTSSGATGPVGLTGAGLSQSFPTYFEPPRPSGVAVESSGSST